MGKKFPWKTFSSLELKHFLQGLYFSNCFTKNFLRSIFSFNFPSENIFGKQMSFRNVVLQNVLLKIIWEKENHLLLILWGKYSSDFLNLSKSKRHKVPHISFWNSDLIFLFCNLVSHWKKKNEKHVSTDGLNKKNYGTFKDYHDYNLRLLIMMIYLIIIQPDTPAGSRSWTLNMSCDLLRK